MEHQTDQEEERQAVAGGRGQRRGHGDTELLRVVDQAGEQTTRPTLGDVGEIGADQMVEQAPLQVGDHPLPDPGHDHRLSITDSRLE